MLIDLNLDSIVLLTAFLLISGVVATKCSTRLGIPVLILFILIGMLIGSDGLGIIYFDDEKYAQIIGIVALIIILFEGGLQTKWSNVRPVIAPSLLLATIGVILTSAIVGFAAKMVFNVTWIEAFLFAAIIGPTDAAAVFAVLKERKIHQRLEATLTAESGANDPMAIFLTLTFIEIYIHKDLNLFSLMDSFLWQMCTGFIVGFLCGKFAAYAINRIDLDSSGLYPIFTLALALFTYSVTDMIDGSGFLAVYVAAVVIGNSDIVYRYSIFRVMEGLAWMAQILMFIILGLLAFPGNILLPDIIIKGLILSAVLMFIARPLAVFLSTPGLPLSGKEKLFLSWAGLRGAVPIILATFPIVAGFENSTWLFNVVFFIVLTSAFIQGSTIGYVAQTLQLVDSHRRP